MSLAAAAVCCSQNFVVEPEGAFEAMEYTEPMQPAELDVASVRVRHWIDPEHSNTPISAAFLGNAKMLLKLGDAWAPIKAGFVLEPEEAFPGEGLTVFGLPVVLSQSHSSVLKKLDAQCRDQYRRDLMKSDKLLSWHPAVRTTHAVLHLALSTAELPSRIQVIDASGVRHKGYGLEFLLEHVGSISEIGDWVCMPVIVEPHIIRTNLAYDKRDSKLIMLVHDIVFKKNSAKRKRFELPDAEVDRLVEAAALKRTRGKCV